MPSAQTWYQELRACERDDSITFPTALTVLAAAESKARATPQSAAAAHSKRAPPPAPALAAPGSSLPTWEHFWQQAPHTNAQDILSLLDGLASVPDASASHVAGAVLIIIKHLHLPPKASQLLNLATTAALLVPAAKNAWLLCPEANKHRLRPELERLCSTVATKFASTLSGAAKILALPAIQPHITANAARPGVNWSSVALQPASTPSFPLTAYIALDNVVDATTFRQGIHQLCQPTCLSTATEYQHLQERVKQFLPVVREVESSDWFFAGLSAPPPARRRPTLSCGPTPSARRPDPPHPDCSPAATERVPPALCPTPASPHGHTPHRPRHWPSQRPSRGHDRRPHAHTRDPSLRHVAGHPVRLGHRCSASLDTRLCVLSAP